MSPISSILVDKFGIRKTAFTGGFIATLGMFLSSFAVEKVSTVNLDIVDFEIVEILVIVDKEKPPPNFKSIR